MRLTIPFPVPFQLRDQPAFSAQRMRKQLCRFGNDAVIDVFIEYPPALFAVEFLFIPQHIITSVLYLYYHYNTDGSEGLKKHFLRRQDI